MRNACLNVTGSNKVAIDKIRKKGDLLEQELSDREKSRREQEKAVSIRESRDVDQALLETTVDRNLTDWDEAKLLKMIRDGIEENLGVEYKAAAALSRESRKTSEITKDVSAMANSAGGILIYGISQCQEPAREHLPERIDPICRTDYSKEWLEHIISQIRPRINDLKIHPVQLASASDHVVYVVEIPQGTTAHQATDFRYYRRYNFESVPMLDHEVRDVMNRKAHPRIAVTAQFYIYPHQNQDGAAGSLTVSVKNASDVFARYVALIIHSPLRVRGNLISYKNEAILDVRDEGHAYTLSFSNHHTAPLFPRGTLSKNFQFWYVHHMTPEPDRQLGHFCWTVFADAMPRQRGTFTVDEILTTKLR